MAAVFSVSSIVLVQIKSIREVGDSVIAFYAADTGIETALNDLYDSNFQASYEGFLDGPLYKYNVEVTQPPTGTLPVIPVSLECTGKYYCIKSTGTYYNVKRAIEVKDYAPASPSPLPPPPSPF